MVKTEKTEAGDSQPTREDAYLLEHSKWMQFAIF